MKLSHLPKILGASVLTMSLTVLSSSTPAFAQYEEGNNNSYPSESAEYEESFQEFNETTQENLDRAAQEASENIEATGAAAVESLESAGQATQQTAERAVQQIESATNEAQRNIEATAQQAQKQMAETAEELEERANWGWLGLLGLLGLFGLFGRKKEHHRDTTVSYDTDPRTEPFPERTATTNSNRTL